jgi:hypothetical protein
MLLMAYAASAVGKLREDEAEGYLDNLVVRLLSRQRWLAGRMALVVAVIVVAAVLGGMVFWIAAAAEHTGLGVSPPAQAGLNAAAPAVALAGLGALLLGLCAPARDRGLLGDRRLGVHAGPAGRGDPRQSQSPICASRVYSSIILSNVLRTFARARAGDRAPAYHRPACPCCQRR